MRSQDDNLDPAENAGTLIKDFSKRASADPSQANVPARMTVPERSSTRVVEAGTVLQGRYEVEKELGRGGIGAVYLARDTKLHSRPVVVKVLLGDGAQDTWVYRKFLQEVEALTRIEHPNIVGVLDSGELPDGKPFIVMQYVDGSTLRSQLKPEGMNLERVALMVSQIGRALNVAHSKGILHRDLKPENIMIQLLGDSEEQVKIIDFGIARVQNSQIGPTTQTTSMAGTIFYMSPEQLAAQPLDVTSDIYALGIIAYEMITGRRPYNPDSIVQLYAMHRDGLRVNPKDLRPALPEAAQEVLLKALAFEPANRYQSAREFCDELADALKSGFEDREQSHGRANATRQQRVAAATAQRQAQPAVEGASAWAETERPKSRSWTSPTLLISITLVVLLGVTGMLIYNRLNRETPVVTAPPKPTGTEFNDEFLNLARWTVPPANWNINTREGRLEIENQPEIGVATGINYDNFDMTFHLKLLNDAGAAWALRIKDTKSYYLFYLSGPSGIYKNRFLTYVVQDGKVNPSIFNLSTPITAELKAGGQYEVNIHAEGNQIEHKITPAETGEEVNLGLFRDPENTYTIGGIGFRTVGIEKFSVDDLYVRPSGTRLPQ